MQEIKIIMGDESDQYYQDRRKNIVGKMLVIGISDN